MQPEHNLKTAYTSMIGNIFINRRALMSLSEEDVSTQAFISINYIRAIESGDYSVFPARIFALRYYTRYANFLNIQIPFFVLYNINTRHIQEENKYFSTLSFSWLFINFIKFYINDKKK